MFDTVYVSAQIPSCASGAASAISDWHRTLTTSVLGRPAAKNLWVAAEFIPQGANPHTVRRIAGCLLVWGVPVRVEIELAIWSADSCEVGLRPFNLRWPVSTERYRQAALSAVTEVAKGIVAEVPTPVITGGAITVLRFAS